MVNIYDKAHELAKALKESPEVIEFRKVNEKISSNETNRKMLEDFRRLQFEAYSEQMQKGNLSKETTEKLNNLGNVISMNPDIAQYLQAEARFGVIWEDIIKILNDAVGLEDIYKK